MVELPARREAAEQIRQTHPEISQRRAAKLVEIPRSTLRYHTRPQPESEKRRELIREEALRHPRYGYRRVTIAVRARCGAPVNHKSVQRTMQELRLQVPRRRRRKWLARAAAPGPQQTQHPDEGWSMDFVFDWSETRRRIKVFTLVDRCTRESLAMRVSHSIRARHVVDALDTLRVRGRCPKQLTVDHGPEFISTALSQWCLKHKVDLRYIEPGRPMQNGHAESFNGRLRDECLNMHSFLDIEDAARKICAWWREYNCERPHSALKGQTPIAFAKSCGVTAFASHILNTAGTQRRQGNPAGALRATLTPPRSCRKNL